MLYLPELAIHFATMAAPNPKRPRKRLDDESKASLGKLLHIGSVTNVGLAEILQSLQNLDGLHASRRQLDAVNLEAFHKVRHVEHMPLSEGGEWQWELCEPNRLLAMLIESSPGLAAIYGQALERYPCVKDTPWQMIVGFDEFIPGAKLKSHNERKSMNLSFTFVELGKDALWHESIWLTPICVRHAMIDRVDGGFSAMFKRYLKLHLLGATGLSTAGVPITINGQHVLLFGKLSFLLADGDGFKLALEWKGANGVKPCVRHWNVISKRSDLGDASETFVDICCADASKFFSATSQDIFNAVDTLLEGHRLVREGLMTRRRLDQLQKSMGFQPSPVGILADRELRPHFPILSILQYDWVHTALQDGTLSEEAFLVVQAAKDLGITMQHLQTFMKDGWSFPSASTSKSRVLYQIFDPRRSPKEERLKCSASELLGMYGLLRHFVETRIPADDERVALQVASFYACCKTVDIIKAAKAGTVDLQTAATLLRAALEDHLTKHIAAYGRTHIRPKHHWMFDVAEQWLSAPLVFDAFIIERLHLRMKSIADPIDNTRTYERSVLAGMINSQVRILQQSFCQDGLLGGQANVVGAGVIVADKATLGGLNLSVGDLAFDADTVGQVVAIAREGDGLFAIVKVMEFHRKVSEHSALWRPTDAVCVWRMVSMSLPLAWSIVDGGLHLVIAG